MHYYSTNNKSLRTGFREAALKGQPEDKGLYFPSEVPGLPEAFFDNIRNITKEEIALQVIRPFIGDAIPATELEKIVKETICFDFPLIPVTESISSLELFHGPTLAFKDVGARFMSRCFGYFAGGFQKKTTVLVATSGDTGGAVAHAFHHVPDVDVVILYPSGKVSQVQELQLTALGGNIQALEIAGNFDDCQQMVKQAFADPDLNKKLMLTSANSINVARWLPQQFYYFFAYSQWNEKENPPVISVPSGNFGNICAGLMALRAGLPVRQFIAACNANDAVPSFMKTGSYAPRPTVHTLSNAMDVGNPSNFVRILQLFDHQLPFLRQVFASNSISDEETKKVMADVYSRTGYMLDPHGAVGYLALQQYLERHPGQKGFFLETAHPVKFLDVVEPVIQARVMVPEAMQRLMQKEKKAIPMKADSRLLKDFLLSKH